MKQAEIRQRVKNNLRSEKYDNIRDLLIFTRGLMQELIPTIRHGKEMTDEANDFPTPTNILLMELARNNVLVKVQEFADKVSERYNSLPSSSKRVLQSRMFAEIVSDGLCMMLGEEA